MKLLITLIAALLLMVNTFAQNNSFKINSLLQSVEDGSPLAGAVITVKSTSSITRANSQGSFQLNSTRPDSLFITMSGFKPLIFYVDKNTPLPAVISMQPLAKQLEEVQVNSVNTGYQAISKERATGSFEKLNNSLFNQQVTTTVLARLETIANGLYIDKKTNPTSPAFTIRGLSTIQGQRAPLIILDNFPYEGDLANINPNDVESITILKDAAAASIWGTRAGNGVIVITSKKAKLNQPLRIEINNNITIAQKPGLFYYNNITAPDFIELEKTLYSKGYYTASINSSSKPALSPVVELLIKKANGSISPADADAKINALAGHDLRNDFNRYMYQAAVNQQHAITLRGGSGNIAYLFSAGYDRNIGTLNDKYSRITLRSENTWRLGNRLRLMAGITYIQSGAATGKVAYGIANLPIYTQLADDAGNPMAVIKQYRQPYLDTAGAGKLLDWNYYPLTEHNQVNNKNMLRSVTGNLATSFRLTKSLSAEIKYQYQQQSTDNNTIYSQESFTARDLINAYSQLNRATGVVTYKVPMGGILSSSVGMLQAHNVRGQLSFSKKWRKHECIAIAGTEIRSLVTTASSSRTYGYNSNILSFTPIDFANPYPHYITGFTSLIPNEQFFSERANRYVSFFANAAYTFLSKYSFTISGRRDASNLFGVNTNDKWTPLWSAGMGWDISKEKFYRFKKIPYLKWRATYGISGNADPSKSGYTVLAYTLTSPYTQLPTARIDQFTNPGLRWEKITMLNVGLDFKAFNNRLQGSVEYYRKKGKDLFGYQAMDYTNVPTNRLVKNAASMKASGWDIEIHSINIQSAFTWTTTLNFNTNKDKVTNYLLTSRSASGYLNGGLNISALEGKPVYGIYAYAWAGLDPQNGDPRGWLNGQVSKDYNSLLATAYPVDSLVYKGPALPACFGSLGNTFSYKGLSVIARLSWKMGYYFLRNSVNYSSLFSSRQGHGDYALRWQNPGDELTTDVPSLVYPAVSRRDQFYNNAEILVEKADHIRLQYITLDYDLKKAFKRLPVSNLNFYININNIGIVWRANKKGIDPDYRDNTILPTKNYAIGIRTSL